MLKKILWVLAVLFASITPVAAQQPDVNPVALIPADFAGFVNIRVDNDKDTLVSLDAVRDTASIFQPARVQATGLQSIFSFPIQLEEFDDFIVLDTLTDVEDASFTNDILPWVTGDFVVAYRESGDDFTLDAEDVLFIFPTENIFLAAQSFQRFIAAQSNVEESDYRDVRLYELDESTVAFAENVVFLGSSESIQASLDIMSGEAVGFDEDEAYQIVKQAAPDDALAFAYLTGEESLSALNFILSGGDEASRALLQAIGDAMGRLRTDESLLEYVLSGSADGVGISLVPEDRPKFRANLDAVITVYDAEVGEVTQSSPVDDALLELLPHNTMLMLAGSDVDGFVFDVLSAAPTLNFAGQALQGFSVQPSIASRSGAFSLPTGTDIETAVTTSLAAIQSAAGYSLENSLLNYLSGDYVLAMIPRPNNPTPLFDTRADFLLLAQVDDAEEALDGVTRLVQLTLGVQSLDSSSLDEDGFITVALTATDEPLMRFGVLDDVLVVATGMAAEAVLEAHEGDDRLIDQPQWAAFAEGENPDLYIDLTPFSNTFFPTPGGPGPAVADQLGLWTRYEGDGIFQIDVTVRSDVRS
ncbi:MAG: DUF3352 domain-containing protein [Chloroflexi bacterium]|nr:MAG: DUF3352 domain-containing protein [Chloroflexota bacterium]